MRHFQGGISTEEEARTRILLITCCPIVVWRDGASGRCSIKSCPWPSMHTAAVSGMPDKGKSTTYWHLVCFLSGHQTDKHT